MYIVQSDISRDHGGKSAMRGECPGPGPDCELMMMTTLAGAMEWWRGVTRSRCHVWRSDETKWAGIIINTLPSPLHSRYTTEYHRNLGICWGLLDTSDNTKRRSVDISIEASYLCRCILHEQLCIMRFCIEGFGIRKIRFRHVETPLNLSICWVWVDSRYISLLSTSRYLSLLSMSRYI